MRLEITQASLTQVIRKAAQSRDGELALRDYVLGPYYDEDDYSIGADARDLLDVLFFYVIPTEKQTEQLSELALTRLLYMTEKLEKTRESAIVSLSFDEIDRLVQKHQEGHIDDFTYRRKIRQIVPIDYDALKLMRLFREYQATLRCLN